MSYRSTDKAGNVELAKAVSFKLDATVGMLFGLGESRSLFASGFFVRFGLPVDSILRRRETRHLFEVAREVMDASIAEPVDDIRYFGSR